MNAMRVTAPMPLLEAKNVTIRFGGLTAVSDFNLTIEPHELVISYGFFSIVRWPLMKTCPSDGL